MKLNWKRKQKEGTKLKGKQKSKANASNQPSTRARRRVAASQLGNVVPHDIPTEETRGAREEQKHAFDADECRVPRHFKAQTPVERHTMPKTRMDRTMSCYTTFAWHLYIYVRYARVSASFFHVVIPRSIRSRFSLFLPSSVSRHTMFWVNFDFVPAIQISIVWCDCVFFSFAINWFNLYCEFVSVSIFCFETLFA